MGRLLLTGMWQERDRTDTGKSNEEKRGKPDGEMDGSGQESRF